MAIPLGLNFNLGAQVPLDNRIVVANIAARDALVTANRVYQGIIVYVTNENRYYYYDGTNWQLLSTTGLGATGSTGPTGPPGTPGGATGATGPTGPPGVGMSNFTYVNSATTVTKNTKIGVDTTINNFTITLPTSNLNIGDVIEIIDLNKTFDLRNLVINGTIEGSSLGLICNVKGAHFNLIWVGGAIGWEISIIDNNFSTAGVLDVENVVPLLYLDIRNENELFDSPDSTNYKIPWNNIQWTNPEFVTISSTIDETKYVTYNSINKNIYIKEPGIYNIDLRYGSFNMIDSSDFLRARLRSSNTPIEGGLSSNPPSPPSVGLSQPDNGGPNVFAAFAQGAIGTTQNGEAMCAGFTTFRIETPTYLVVDFLHFGAFNTTTSLARGFPVFSNTFGNRPFLFLSKIV